MENLEELDSGHFRCRVCGKDSTGMTKTAKKFLKHNMKKHAETHIDGLFYPCQLCVEKNSGIKIHILFINH